jgi:hypothetical protein
LNPLPRRSFLGSLAALLSLPALSGSKLPAPTPKPTGQPLPLITQVGHLEVNGATVSAITRRWADGDPARCRLCPAGECGAYRGSCTVLVNRLITIDEAERFARKGGVA